MLLAIDPGTRESAFVILFDSGLLAGFDKLENTKLLHALRELGEETVVIEKISMGGMIAGAEIFETCFWSGKFAEAAESNGREVHRLTRMDVKMHLCGQTRAKDVNVRQALIDRYGPGKDIAIGTKKKPGPLYGIKADVWAALAVGVTFGDKNNFFTNEEKTTAHGTVESFTRSGIEKSKR